MFKTFSGVGIVLFGLTLSPIVVAEDNATKYSANDNHKKGSFYAHWGWNRSYYSDSDIHFKGDDYNFTLKGASASDRPSEVGFDPYLHPLELTTPQTNFKIGYFFTDNYSVTFGFDHMKYIMDQYQTAIIDGYIASGSEHDGTYDDEAISLNQYDSDGNPTLLEFEHSDGLNYINVEINNFDNLYSFTSNLKLSRIFGAGIGLMIPKTNATLLENARHDDFHISGWGSHIKAGLELSYTKYFMRSEVKTGYINMQDIRTTASSSDVASQYFTFTEVNLVFGRYF